MPTRSRARAAASWATATKIGTPDHTPGVISTKPVVSAKDTTWEAYWAVNIAGGGTTSSDIYTVPDGYRLNVGGFLVTCDLSQVQRLILAKVAGTFGDYRYDMFGQITFGPMDASRLEAGDILTITLYNGDYFAHDFTVNMVGVLEAVE